MYLEKLRLDGRVAVVTGGGAGDRRRLRARARRGRRDGRRRRHGGRRSREDDAPSCGARHQGPCRDARRDQVEGCRCASPTKWSKDHGRVDILVNNAGVAKSDVRAEDTSDEHWRFHMDVNVDGVFWCCRAFGRQMLKQGSGLDRQHRLDVGLHRQQAAAAELLQRLEGGGASPDEVARRRMGHSAACASTRWRRPISRRRSPPSASTRIPEMYKTWLEMTPMGRVGQPDEIASVVLFLAVGCGEPADGHRSCSPTAATPAGRWRDGVLAVPRTPGRRANAPNLLLVWEKVSPKATDEGSKNSEVGHRESGLRDTPAAAPHPAAPRPLIPPPSGAPSPTTRGEDYLHRHLAQSTGSRSHLFVPPLNGGSVGGEQLDRGRRVHCRPFRQSRSGARRGDGGERKGRPAGDRSISARRQAADAVRQNDRCEKDPRDRFMLGGYSTIWMARALPKDGRLITLEADAKHAKVAGKNVAKAGFADIVDIRVGKALDTLPKLQAEGAAIRGSLSRRRQAEQSGILRVGAEAVASRFAHRRRQRRAFWRADRRQEHRPEREGRAALHGSHRQGEARQRHGDTDRRDQGP